MTRREKKGKAKDAGSRRVRLSHVFRGGCRGRRRTLTASTSHSSRGLDPSLKSRLSNLVTSARRALCMRTKLMSSGGSVHVASLSGGYSAGRTGVNLATSTGSASGVYTPARLERGELPPESDEHAEEEDMGRGEARSGSSREGGARARAVARRRAKPLRENIARVKVREDNWREDRVSSASKPPRRVDGSQILDRKGCPGQRVPRAADWVPKSSVKIDRR